jgi:hypothetical protein
MFPRNPCGGALDHLSYLSHYLSHDPFYCLKSYPPPTLSACNTFLIPSAQLSLTLQPLTWHRFPAIFHIVNVKLEKKWLTVAKNVWLTYLWTYSIDGSLSRAAPPSKQAKNGPLDPSPPLWRFPAARSNQDDSDSIVKIIGDLNFFLILRFWIYLFWK